MGLAQNIEALLIKFEISAEGLACRVGVSPATVSRWRNGMGMRQSTVKRICEAFELEPDALLSDSRGLAATVLGTAGPGAPRIPLVSADDALAWTYASDETRARLGAAEATIEIPRFVAEGHPAAFALAVDGTPMGDAHIVIDPDTEPQRTSLVAMAVTARAVRDVRRPRAAAEPVRVVLRRPACGDTAEISDPDGQRGASTDAGAPQASSERLIGAVVWFQAADVLH